MQITQFGGPEVLTVRDIEPPTPQPGWVLLDVSAAGVNYADTHQIENSSLTPQRLPLIPGAEVVGQVRGGDLDGTRMVALLTGGGGYAEQAVAPTATVFPIGDDLDDTTALALVLQGTTAWHLLRSCARLHLGDSVVVHSAAGGVGTLAVQLARQWGAGRVIATASGPDKCELAARLGADATVDVSRARSAAAVEEALRTANDGRGVDIVLEMAGGIVFDGSLRALATGGRLVCYGMASRIPPDPVDSRRLMATSTTVSGFGLAQELRHPGSFTPPMEELVSLVRARRLTVVPGGRYPLAAAGRAHAALRSRRTSGKLVLDVQEPADR